MPRKNSNIGKFPADAFTAGVEDDDDVQPAGNPQAGVESQPSTDTAASIAVDLHGDSGAGPEPSSDPDTVGLRNDGDGAATLGDVLGSTLIATTDEPLLPGFAMSDDPLPPPVTQASVVQDYAADQVLTTSGLSGAGPIAPQQPGAGGGFPDAATGGSQLSYTEARNKMVRDHNAKLDAPEEIIPPQQPTSQAAPRYTSRIRILEAWQYPGGVAGAPDFVDRNWIGWASSDELRGMEPGPCLRVPITADPDENVVVVARRGDFVVHEEITGDDGLQRLRVEVWEKDQFLKLFMPAAATNGTAEKLVKATTRKSA